MNAVLSELIQWRYKIRDIITWRMNGHHFIPLHSISFTPSMLSFRFLQLHYIPLNSSFTSPCLRPFKRLINSLHSLIQLPFSHSSSFHSFTPNEQQTTFHSVHSLHSVFITFITRFIQYFHFVSQPSYLALFVTLSSL